MQNINFTYLVYLGLFITIIACNKNGPVATDQSFQKRESWKNAGCELVTDPELEQHFGFNARAVSLNSRTLPDQTFCLRTWQKPDWKERELANEKNGETWLNPQNRLVVQLIDYGTPEVATKQLEMLRRDRRATYEEDVKGVGEDAVWSTPVVTLMVKKDKYLLSIAIEYDDVAHDNLAKAKQVAEIALKKL